ncbi:ABR065Wp [Eremothecium gossypii ATCC 10895]|uniref:Large ribosomal subunit protein mL44 n=1 Tax=Eremothecium gossypii (strain ATCC 10895 / CBS 109.51 / FGSC 9923 / NRRL Y-1056) TaxID=284811 RepID=Q75DG1_EREGS|nr:mitochondrial 54S ribosomal protein YmL3 [Eremothecium gossypii ATCC 10895]AAS50835.2 ABR065Wp [Eremothecium gossypii ATCC 10895]AEY95124.1 FABR065Wp [Eremothecium gossypii FDAG1]
MPQVIRALRCFHSGIFLRQGAVGATGAGGATELEKYRGYFKQLQQALETGDEEAAGKSPLLHTLHSRLALPQQLGLGTLSRCLNCPSANLADVGMKTAKTAQNKEQHNRSLNILGKNLLTLHAMRRLVERYPRLPVPVLNAAVDAYIGLPVLAQIGRGWGIESERETVMERFLRQEPSHMTLGRLRFFNNTLKEIDGIRILSSSNMSESASMAMAVRSIVGALWASTQDLQLVERFLDAHVMSRKLPITQLFMFEQPTRELARLCSREGLERPVSKLIAETGRLSKAPVFVVGVFSGEEKLGEGFGSSLKEAKARAATDALMKWYCYQPLPSQGPVIDPGQVLV